MKRLELFINPADQGSHYFIVADGHVRQEHEFRSQDCNAMHSQAIAILSADSSFASSLRIFDTSRRYVKSGEMTVSLETLKTWQNN